ncbi:MAG: hypothetical protein MUF34_08475 [Polyangiaceae bacterium]|nr:hypothetical protein [Polyangiaceae bacterium]
MPNGFQLNINDDGLFDSGTGACKEDPYSPGCFSCAYLTDPAERTAAGCENFGDAVADPTGFDNAKSKFDRVNQRCFQQRKRFGFEALHPVQRYIALNKAVPDATDAKFFADDNPTNRVANNIVAPKVDNPLFVDLPWRRYEASCTGEGDAKVCQLPKPIGREAELAQRPSGRIYFAGIVGVPWQDIAVNPTTLESAPGRPGGFQPPGAINWDLILGPALAGRVTEFGDPLDPLMRESIEPRVVAGAMPNDPRNVHPVTKEDLAGPWNKINGHEWTNPIADDLQYACIFPLNDDVECNPPAGQPRPEACDCTQTAGLAESDPAVRKNPLCEAYTAGDPAKTGGTGTFTTLQARAKAYPGSRFLEVLKGIGDSAVVASICPEEIRPTENARDNFGYRPAVNAIIDRLKNALKGRCLPRRLDVQDNKTPCLVIEARYARDANGVSQASATDIAACQQCTAPGYTTLSPELRATLQAQSTPTPNDDPTDFECLCQFQQLTDDGLRVCQTTPGDPSSISGVNGWCYVDPLLAASEEDRTLQNEIVKDCAGSEKRTLRFIGTQPSTGSTDESTSVFITCLGAASNSLPNVTPTTPTP